MSTHYTVTFDKDGSIKGIQSLSHGKTVWNIKHPVKDDTFVFIIQPPSSGEPTYKSVRVSIGSANATELFNYKNSAGTLSAYVPFGMIHTVTYDGRPPNEKTFSFAPSTTAVGSTILTDGDGRIVTPDAGTIKVGG